MRKIPSNVILKKLKPRVWLSICMFGFGLGKSIFSWRTTTASTVTLPNKYAVTMLQGLVQNYSGLLATRFFLGVFETGMFPGAFVRLIPLTVL